MFSKNISPKPKQTKSVTYELLERQVQIAKRQQWLTKLCGNFTKTAFVSHRVVWNP